jgi:hypothetical protein
MWFTDPFARATDDVGQLSAFDTAGTVTDFDWTDDGWKVPGADDLVLYELQCVAAAAGDPLAVTVPSNYGYVLVSPA